MNMKINTICFILLLFLLISVASAADNNDNETLHTINQPDYGKLETKMNDTVVGKSIVDEVKLAAAGKNAVAASSKSTSKKEKVTLKVPNVKMYYADGSKLKITLKDSKKKAMKNTKVKIEINGNTYSKKTNSNGIATMNLKFVSGTYRVTTTYEGSSKYAKKSTQSTVTIKSTIKAEDMTLYYGNKEWYSATLYNHEGKVLKKTKIKYQFGDTIKDIKTSNKGKVKILINKQPGKYPIGFQNTKTGEALYKQIIIKSTIENNNFLLNKKGQGEYSVKLLDKNGHPNPHKQVTIRIGNKVFTEFSNNEGIATLKHTFNDGECTIICEYEGQIISQTYNIELPKPEPEEVVKKTEFSHITTIPTYVNVTNDYVFHYSEYVLKNGTNGIIKMPKNMLITVQIQNNAHLFASPFISGHDAHTLESISYLIPFDGSSIKSAYNKNKLEGEGILLSREGDNINIEYRSSVKSNTDTFGMYIKPTNMRSSETIAYIQNNKEMALVNFFTDSYDEFGVQYNIAKLYNKMYYEFDHKTYEEMTSGYTDNIRYTKTNEPVEFGYFGNYIAGNPSKEDLTMKFIVDGVEELEKKETISYGLSDKYHSNVGFEVLQSYVIINQKVTPKILDYWMEYASLYSSLKGVTNIYGMFLTSLETAWIADEIADNYAKELNVSWSRDKTLTVMSGINFDDTYIHILNADMGMKVTGEKENEIAFRFFNSIYLSDIEEYCLSSISDEYNENSTNSLDNILLAIGKNNVSVVQLEEMIYILSEDGSNSTIILNTTSGISSVIVGKEGFAYKGSTVNTACDCCSIVATPVKIIKTLTNTINNIKNHGLSTLGFLSGKAARVPMIAYQLLNVAGTVLSKVGVASIFSGAMSTVSLILSIHSVGNYIKNEFIDKKDWHWVYKHITFTRDSPLENKKLFNIPKSDGTYDYVEVKIKSNGYLDRDNAVYISDGNVRKLTKSETYKYFSEESWVAWNIPKKYQKHPVPF